LIKLAVGEKEQRGRLYQQLCILAIKQGLHLSWNVIS